MGDQLRRLLSPRTIAVVGGREAEVAARQCRAIGYDGEIWPVHPRRAEIDGWPCFADVAQLPGVPDAAFVAVSREKTVKLVAELARLGVGGVVCHASGFAESGEYGAALERDLVAAADGMALLGPNCLGHLNYLDGVALWSEQHGGSRVESGVAVIAQSGNIAQNLSMQRRTLPIAQLVTIGNSAVTDVPDLIEQLLTDSRVTAIGLYLEEIPDVAKLSRAAIEALRRRVPIVALKSGSSELGARVTLSHTSSLAGPDVIVDALFHRLGIARVHDLDTFLETLKLLHVHGSLPGLRIASASCSGGEAAHIADLAHPRGLLLPELSESTRTRLHAVLGDRVAVRNPLDYHTYIWGDYDALTACFTAFLDEAVDCHLLLLDFPRADRCDVSEFETTIAAFETAQKQTGARACVVASLPEGLPESIGQRLMEAGIAPMQGVGSCLVAIVAAQRIGEAQAAPDVVPPLLPVSPADVSRVEQLDEQRAKETLASYGVAVPRSLAARDPGDVPGLAAELGFPVVLKALSTEVAHKSDVGGVRLGLNSEDAVRQAVADMPGLGDQFLVEQMVDGVVLELIVGVRGDPQFGLALTLGAGGELVELIQDAATILLPATAADIRAALRRLRIWPVLTGFRGRSVDLDPVVDAIASITVLALDHAERLVELEVNPLLVLPHGAVAVDALIRLAEQASGESATY
ncbi:MAG TPA: acetate--CoA ligase family protein [Nocardioidaceae bacterium]|nr:acetate--CoA ligase family protein [Nocardioidaceae bacterium]